MKKIIAMVMVIVTALSLCACGTAKETAGGDSAIQHPDVNVHTYMERPDYTIKGDCTPDDLRDMAIKAMRDELTIQYVPTRFLMYWKLTNAKQNLHTRAPYVVYTGMPYCSAGSSLFSFWEYVEPETGHFTWPEDGIAMDKMLGNTCANSVCWGWSAVSNTIGGFYSTYFMNQYNGYLPVGDYIYRGANNYKSYSCAQVIADNTQETMYEAYAKMRRADALVSSGENSDDHAMMTITDPEVVRNPDGTVNGEKSTVHIQDQRGGTGGYYYIEKDDKGNDLLLVGRTDAVFTFAELYQLTYLPVTCAEFLGEDPYEPSKITFSGKTDTVKSIFRGTIQSNYLLCNVKLVSVDENGKEKTEALRVIHKTDIGKDIVKDTTKIGASILFDDISEEEIVKLAQEKTLYLVADNATGHSVRLAEIPKA